MIVTHNGERYRVRWTYHIATHAHRVSQEIRGMYLRSSYVQELTPRTTCVIEVGSPDDTWTPIAEGIATCNYTDLKIYSKERGRKLSLKRALENTFLYPATRQLFWEEYAKQTNKGWATDLRFLPEEGLSPDPQSQGVDMPGMSSQDAEEAQ